jgi:hypothetical protein
MLQGLFGNASEVDGKKLEKELDAEIKIYISGNMNPIEREFKRGTDVKGIQKTLAHFILR